MNYASLSGSDDAASFIDDTSLNTSAKGKGKVSIHAEVLRGRPLDWYFELLKRSPTRAGEELKSSEAASTYFTLPYQTRMLILGPLGLGQVRLHIFDPRPYVADIEGMCTETLGTDVRRWLAEYREADKMRAEEFEQQIRNATVQSMVWDSPAEQLKLRHRVWGRLRAINLHEFWEEPPDAKTPAYFDYSAFKSGRARNPVNTASCWLSKSGPVFFDALDELDEIMGTSQFDSFWTTFRIRQAMGHGRAYDEGCTPAIKWIEERRDDALSTIDSFGSFADMPLCRLEELKSEQEFRVQAADIAAGIARLTWEASNLPTLSGQFEYLTYNGRRISEEDAARIQDKLASL